MNHINAQTDSQLEPHIHPMAVLAIWATGSFDDGKFTEDSDCQLTHEGTWCRIRHSSFQISCVIFTVS